MTSVFDSISSWARKTTTSFADLRHSVSQRPEHDDAADGQAYQLRYWPDLTGARTADVLRALSVMSHRPVNRRWILASTKLSPLQVDTLIADLVAQDAVTIIDTARYPSAPAITSVKAATAGAF